MSNRVPLPEDFTRRIRTTFPGHEPEEFLRSMEAPPVNSVRINPRKVAEAYSNAEVIPWCPYGYYLQERPLFTLDPLFHGGGCYPQEASSMFLWHVMESLVPKEDREDLKVLDLCGAPGGKSSLLASFLDGRGLLVTNEVIQSRAWILRENMLKWGAPNVVVSRSDPSEFSRVKGLFDIMVVDAPCSGEGMFRKGDVARREWSEENAALCSVRQRRILQDAWPALKEGGWLIYSTCTFNGAENEENIKWLIENQMAEIVPLKVPTLWGIEEISVDNGNGLAFYPHKVRGEGFFVAALRKNGHHTPQPIKNTKRKQYKVPDSVSAVLKNPGDYSFFESDGLWKAFPAEYENFLYRLQKHLKILDYGISLGSMGRKEFIPDPVLPLSWAFKNRWATHALDREEALRYLKGQSLQSGSNLPKGFIVVCYNQLPLGFVKNVGSRFNNLFPKKWRIRMDIDRHD
ncbi:methyltransferase RsmF C-terminal domain-like protein [Thermophagus sp. OGC60D27]|uniref:methyltransferase RsmF C-terminal domain-like protein n=1 Tax=Thermophagus sp. OGC60D27 TaxID=3458415 RepID=UPI004037C07C